jgi:hypothetical protein
MGYWNYRLVYHPPSKYKVGKKEFDREEYLAIHEVHYDNDENPVSMTVDPIVVGDEGEDSLVSLKWILENQLKALEKPILQSEMTDEIFKELETEKQNEYSKSIKSKE